MLTDCIRNLFAWLARRHVSKGRSNSHGVVTKKPECGIAAGGRRGTLVGGAGGQPVASTPGTQVLLNRPADAFGVATSGSIGPTAAEIAEAVWAKVLV